MAKRQVFFSFHYNNDCWRASQVRNMGKVDESSTFSGNDWEEVKEKSDDKIKEWIEDQLNRRSYLLLLIGEQTADRKWINYEIKRAYALNKGIVGIYIHKLKNKDGKQGNRGNNPFEFIILDGKRLSNHVKVFDSSYSSSEYVYDDIKQNIENLIEHGLDHRPSTW